MYSWVILLSFVIGLMTCRICKSLNHNSLTEKHWVLPQADCVWIYIFNSKTSSQMVNNLKHNVCFPRHSCVCLPFSHLC